MGNWEEAFKDLTLAVKLDWDPDTNAALKEVEEKVRITAIGSHLMHTITCTIDL